jgi:hypothetical protein
MSFAAPFWIAPTLQVDCASGSLPGRAMEIAGQLILAKHAELAAIGMGLRVMR